MIARGTHLFADGQVEPPLDSIHLIQQNSPKVRTVTFAVDAGADVTGFPGVGARPLAFWHNMSRWTGYKELREPLESWILFIDADEIPDGPRMARWLSTADLSDTGRAHKLANYWYFRDVHHRSTTHEDSILMVHGSALADPLSLFGDMERDHTFAQFPRSSRGITDDDGRPMWHHFSWVRTAADLRRKVTNWAHARDLFAGADADAVVRAVAAMDLDAPGARDFVHGYAYGRVEDRFGLAPML